MIRDRLKSGLRSAAIKLFKMEKDQEPHAVPNVKLDRAPVSIDRSVIPKVVAGSGDTPGPNHKEDVGRTVLSAAVHSGSAPLLIDHRPPAECAGGMLPGAICVPGLGLKARTDLLPVDKSLRVVVYDQLGSDESAELAAWLRAQGWTAGRRLKGGWAEWIEHDEPVGSPAPPTGGRFSVGDPVERADGSRHWVQEGLPGMKYWLWTPEQGTIGPVAESELK
jgi:rhodanese-related sulfurtransferase